MRSISLCVALSFAAGWSTSLLFADPPADVMELRKQLRDEQVVADELQTSMSAFTKRYQGYEQKYGGDFSGVRLVLDRQVEIQQMSEARAARYWQTLGILEPLKEPLTKSQLDDLDVFTKVFKQTSLSPRASAVLAEHNRLVDTTAANALLMSLKLGDVNDTLTDEQIDSLIEIDNDKRFSETPAAATARTYLRVHLPRQAQARAKAAGWLESVNLEAMATKRLASVRAVPRDPIRPFHLRRALDQISTDFPGTAAGREAQMQSEAIQTRITAEAMRTQNVRSDWDVVSPSRTK